jgi:glucose/arabinose dehydrogenase
MMQNLISPRAGRTVLSTAAFCALLFTGCSTAAKFFYLNEHTQAIRRDTITASGATTSYLQNPADSVNGIIRLTPVEVADLHPVTVSVPAGASSPFDQPRTLQVPAGVAVSVYAYGLGRPQALALRDDGTLFYSNTDGGEIVAIAPDGTRSVVVGDLTSPYGLELHNGALYYTDERHVFRFNFSSPTAVTGTSTTLTDKLPVGGLHYTRTIRWSPTDKRFYISVGSTSNKDVEDDKEHASILRLAETGGNPDVVIHGLRNAIGLDINPESGELWGIDQGIDLLSNDLPPDEINILKVGKNYGFPYYYSQNFRDPEYMKSDTVTYPRFTVGPVAELQAHSEAIDLRFYPFDGLGAKWKNGMLVTLHGSFNRDPATGYKVIRVRANTDGSNARQSDFITGFLDDQGNTWGRPVALAISKDGKTIFLSDDKAGAIYKITVP